MITWKRPSSRSLLSSKPAAAREEKDLVERRPSLMHPLLERLTDRVDSKFTLVALAAKRARQINSYFNQLGEGLGTIVPPQVTSLSRKPLSISLEEIEAGKIVYERPEVVEKSIK
jgi:DNA-directed RNA polymerase subunit omega